MKLGNNPPQIVDIKKARNCEPFLFRCILMSYSTVTDLAKFLGWSTLQPRITAI